MHQRNDAPSRVTPQRTQKERKVSHVCTVEEGSEESTRACARNHSHIPLVRRICQRCLRQRFARARREAVPMCRAFRVARSRTRFPFAAPARACGGVDMAQRNETKMNATRIKREVREKDRREMETFGGNGRAAVTMLVLETVTGLRTRLVTAYAHHVSVNTNAWCPRTSRCRCWYAAASILSSSSHASAKAKLPESRERCWKTIRRKKSDSPKVLSHPPHLSLSPRWRKLGRRSRRPSRPQILPRMRLRLWP